MGRSKKPGVPGKANRDKEKRINLYDKNKPDWYPPLVHLTDTAEHAECAEVIRPLKENLKKLGLRDDVYFHAAEAYTLAKRYSKRMEAKKKLNDIRRPIEKIQKKAEELSELLTKCDERKYFRMDTRPCWKRRGEKEELWGARLDFEKLIESLKILSECLNNRMSRVIEADYPSLNKFEDPVINLFIQEVLKRCWHAQGEWPEIPNREGASKYGVDSYPFVLLIRDLLCKLDGNPRDNVDEEATLVSLISREIKALKDSGEFS